MLINHGNEAVLHLTRGAALRMNIGDLFELQSPFQSNRIVVLATEEEEIVVLGICRSNGTDSIGLLEHHLNLFRQALQPRDDFHAIRHRQMFETPQEQGNHRQNTALTGEDLGRGHPDLRTTVVVDARFGEAFSAAAQDDS